MVSFGVLFCGSLLTEGRLVCGSLLVHVRVHHLGEYTDRLNKHDLLRPSFVDLCCRSLLWVFFVGLFYWLKRPTLETD